MNPIAVLFAVIIVIAGLAAGIYFGLGLLASGNTSNAAQDIMTIVGNAQEVYGVQGDYAGISTNESNVIPKGIQTSTPLGGTFALASSGAGLPASQFDVEMTGLTLSPTACQKLVTQVSDIGTSVNGSPVGNSNAAPTGAQAVSACSGGASSVDFTFGNNS